MKATPNLTEQYEQLRFEVISHPHHGGEGLGLALFLRQGMTAWMQAWSRRTVAPNALSRPVVTTALPIDLRTEVVTLLAGIILGLPMEVTP